jgi:hypothetical protein
MGVVVVVWRGRGDKMTHISGRRLPNCGGERLLLVLLLLLPQLLPPAGPATR